MATTTHQVQEAVQQEALKTNLNRPSWCLTEAIKHLTREARPCEVIQDLCSGAEEFANNLKAIQTCRELLDAIEAQYLEAGEMYFQHLKDEMKVMKKSI